MDTESIKAVDLYREGIEDARRLTFEQKFRLGGDLFDYACDVTKAGIRWENPGLSDQQVLDELRRRIRLGEIIRERSA